MTRTECLGRGAPRTQAYRSCSHTSTSHLMRYYDLIVQQGRADVKPQGGKKRKAFWKRRKFWHGIAGSVIGGLFLAAIIGLIHHFFGPATPTTPNTTSHSTSTGSSPHTSSPSPSAASRPSQSARKFLMSLPVASGDIPQQGLVNIGGRSFPHSLYYTNVVKIPPTYSSHFSLTGNWKVFVAWVGIQPDPTDPEGCSRDSGSTFEVLVDRTRVKYGQVPCGYTQKISVKVSGAHDLNLVFNLNIVGATGDFAWADAQLR